MSKRGRSVQCTNERRSRKMMQLSRLPNDHGSGSKSAAEVAVQSMGVGVEYRGKPRIGIQGWTKTARIIARIILKRSDVELVAINELEHDTKKMIKLFKQDGHWGDKIRRFGTNFIRFSAQGKRVTVLSQPDTADILWRNVEADYVIDADSSFSRLAQVRPFHIQGGAKKLIVTRALICPTFVMGVNHTEYVPHMDLVAVGNGLTNCLAILAKVLFDNFGKFHGHVTAHIPAPRTFLNSTPYPSAADCSGAAMAAMRCVSPQMEYCLQGMTFKYLSDNSVGSVVLSVSFPASYDDIKRSIKNECEGSLHDYLGYMDTIGLMDTSTFTDDPRSCIFDARSSTCHVECENRFQLLAWYDIYYGVSSRFIDFISYMDKRGKEE